MSTMQHVLQSAAAIVKSDILAKMLALFGMWVSLARLVLLVSLVFSSASEIESVRSFAAWPACDIGFDALRGIPGSVRGPSDERLSGIFDALEEKEPQREKHQQWSLQPKHRAKRTCLQSLQPKHIAKRTCLHRQQHSSTSTNGWQTTVQRTTCPAATG